MAAKSDAARDEAVRRLREESARRIARTWRGAVVSRCALGALLSLALLAAQETRRGQVQPEVATAAGPAVPDPAAARERDRHEMCARLLAGSETMREQLAMRLAFAHGKKQRARIWAEMQAQHEPLARAEVERGCPVVSLTPEWPRRPEPGKGSCGCKGC